MRPQDARRALRAIWRDAQVQSCADGSIRIIPKWRSSRGLLTRMYAARMVRSVLAITKAK